MENKRQSIGTFQLYNQVEIPQIGFGTWQVPDGETAADAVICAIEAGYTHIDTAAVYHKEYAAVCCIAQIQQTNALP